MSESGKWPDRSGGEEHCSQRRPDRFSARIFESERVGGCHDHLRRAAAYVDRILKGTKAAELPVQAPTKFEFVIKLKTAKALGLTVPDNPILRLSDLRLPNRGGQWT